MAVRAEQALEPATVEIEPVMGVPDQTNQQFFLVECKVTKRHSFSSRQSLEVSIEGLLHGRALVRKGVREEPHSRPRLVSFLSHLDE